MAQSTEFPVAYLLAALVLESPDGVLSVSQEWFENDDLAEKSFAGKSLALEANDNGNIYITLQEGDNN